MPTPSLLQRLKERKLVQWARTLRQKLTETLKSGHIHISLATGISIIVIGANLI